MTSPPPKRRSVRDIDQLIVDAARPTRGMVLRSTLLELGISDASIRSRLASGFLKAIHPGVYAVGAAGLSTESLLQAALLAGGDQAALSHLTAARIWQISRFEPVAIDLLMPRRSRPLAGTTTRQTRFLPRSHVTVRDDLRLTTTSRTILDLAELLNPWQLTNVLKEARRRNRLRLGTVETFARRHHARHGITVLRDAIEMHVRGSAGTKSPLEDECLDILLGLRLPPPDVNQVFDFGEQGFELDFAWPERRLNIEADGYWGHQEPNRAAQDRLRDACLARHGWRVIRCDTDLIRERPDRMSRLVLAAWDGA